MKKVFLIVVLGLVLSGCTGKEYYTYGLGVQNCEEWLESREDKFLDKAELDELGEEVETYEEEELFEIVEELSELLNKFHAGTYNSWLAGWVSAAGYYGANEGSLELKHVNNELIEAWVVHYCKENPDKLVRDGAVFLVENIEKSKTEYVPIFVPSYQSQY